jgi:hypothetical protein
MDRALPAVAAMQVVYVVEAIVSFVILRTRGTP